VKERQPVILSRGQLSAALAVSGMQPDEHSPLRDLPALGGSPGWTVGDRAALARVGWIQEGQPPRLTPEATGVLRALCRPAVSAGLVIGMRDGVLATQAYSAGGLGAGDLVSYSVDAEHDAYRLVAGISAGDLADALVGQLLPGGLLQTVTFQETLKPAELAAMLGIMDWRLRCVLQSTLDRDPLPDVRFTPADVSGMLVEGRMASDLGWMVTMFGVLLPALDAGLDDGALAGALAGLQAQGLVAPSDDGRYAMGDALLELCHALLPVISFAALNVAANVAANVAVNVAAHGAGGRDDVTHLAFVRGHDAILMAQPSVNERGERVVNLDCLEDADLGSILFELGLPGSKLVNMPAAPVVCPTCGVATEPGQQFCRACGNPLAGKAAPIAAAAPAVCARCQSPLRAGTAFCPRCGARVNG
jgi:hypothetical protein